MDHYAEEAANVHAPVIKDQENPPNYQISGKSSLIAKSSSQSGHNCFTWARVKIKNIANQNIQYDSRLVETAKEFIAAKASHYLTPPQQIEPGTRRCNIP